MKTQKNLTNKKSDWFIYFPPKSLTMEVKLKKLILKEANLSNVKFSPEGLSYLLNYLVETEQEDADVIFNIFQKTGKKFLTEEDLKSVIELNPSKKKKETSSISIVSFGEETEK
jgi:hypothetical protein